VTRSTRRPGYTILEVMVVMAALTILGAVLLPTLSGMSRDTRSKATADILRGLLAEGRSHAMDRSHHYMLSVSADGTQLRIAPDPTDTINIVDETNNAFVLREEKLPTNVKVENIDEDAIPDEDGWIRIATILTDGTLREDQVYVQVTEPGVKPLFALIRGLTGTLTILPGAPEGSNR
jgi:prepilin-type N-terminal cleavage/methylation domain-containing protein